MRNEPKLLPPIDGVVSLKNTLAAGIIYLVIAVVLLIVVCMCNFSHSCSFQEGFSSLFNKIIFLLFFISVFISILAFYRFFFPQKQQKVEDVTIAKRTVRRPISFPLKQSNTPTHSPNQSRARVLHQSQIVDQRSLDNFLEVHPTHQSSFSGFGNQPSVQRHTFNSLLDNQFLQSRKHVNRSTPQYALSRRSVGIIDNRGSQEHWLEIYSDSTYSERAFEKILVNIGIPEQLMFRWTENMRAWIAQFVVNPVFPAIEREEAAIDQGVLVAEVLETLGLRQLLVNKQGSRRPRHERVNFFVQEIMDDSGILTAEDSSHVQQYRKLMKYLSVGHNQQYVRQRLNELQGKYTMLRYRWDGGGEEWSRSLPTDCQIVLHCFLTKMDELFDPFTFSSRFFIPFSAVRNVKDRRELTALANEEITIVQTKEFPPHFIILTDCGKVEWSVKAGRDNLFFTLVLFVFFIDTQKNGRLGHVELSSIPKLQSVIA